MRPQWQNVVRRGEFRRIGGVIDSGGASRITRICMIVACGLAFAKPQAA